MKTWKTWTVEYGLDGKRWALDVVAEDEEDAKRRLTAAANWGQVKGFQVMSVPMWAGGFLVPALVWLRNAFIRV